MKTSRGITGRTAAPSVNASFKVPIRTTHSLFTIVGVVGSVKQADLTEPQGQGAVYVPYRYRDSGNIFVVTRTSQHPEAFADSLRKVVRATDPELAID